MSAAVLATRYRISPDKFKDCPDLEQALMHVLLSMQTDLVRAVTGLSRMHVLPALDVVVSSNTPGTSPWPLRLSQVAGSPVGVLICRIENLSTPGSSGVPTAAVAITSQRVEGGTVFVDFVSGLTVGQTYRIVFGELDGN